MEPPFRSLLDRPAWIFDLDGTLTVAAHDFAAIREELGLPAGLPILEEIARRPPGEARRLGERLDAIELEIANRAKPQDGARGLLSTLRARGQRIGILTRNSEANAIATLEACGLRRFFTRPSIVGRESSPPKPRPEGVTLLLERFDVPPGQALMIGDSRFDLEAGRAAGVAAVYFDIDGTREWEALADHCVEHLGELLAQQG